MDASNGRAQSDTAWMPLCEIRCAAVGFCSTENARTDGEIALQHSCRRHTLTRGTAGGVPRAVRELHHATAMQPVRT
jgi:hypothetical protein